MRRPVTQFAIPCLALAAILNQAGTAAAGSSGYEVATRTVHFADLDLNSRDGVAALYARIEYAAKEVCEPTDSRSVDTRVHIRHCKQQAVDQAVMDSKSSQLMIFHMAAANRMDASLIR